MKLIIITGVNRGLGYALFNYLIGVKDVFIIGISRKITKEQELLLRDKKFEHVKLDLVELRSPKKEINIPEYLDGAKEVVYINNAATIMPIDKIGRYRDNEIRHVIQLNTTTPLLITNYLLGEVKNKKTTVVNISSGAAFTPITGWSLYCATKAANEMFFKTLRLQEKNNEDFNVFNIDPGVMDSGMQQVIRGADEAVFPKINDFITLKSEGNLISVDVAAERIILKSEIL